MAIHNQIFLYAQATEKPSITKKEDGSYIQGIVNLTVAPGSRDIEENVKGKKKLFHVEFSRLPVYSGNPTIVETMDQIQAGDIILIKGNLITRNVTKKKVCPKCGTPYTKAGVLTFVNPIHLSIEQTNLSIEEGEEWLKSHCEVSNVATLIGTICVNPEITAQTKRSMIVSFPLAIDRKFYIASENPETRTDYPYVQVYGKEKGNDVMLRCHAGTEIFVDGIIKTRKYKQMEFPCANKECDYKIPWNDWTIDVVPFALEYMNNWKTDEDIAKEAAHEHEKIFGSSHCESKKETENIE